MNYFSCMMKFILSILFFVPMAVIAQDTCNLKTETDPFTHITKTTTGFKSFQGNGVNLYISIDATPTEVDFFLWIRDESKCFDDKSTAQIIYEGNRLKANYRNTGSMNCEGAFHFTFRNTATTQSNLLRLTDKKVNSIKLTGNDKTVTEIIFTEEQKDQLKKMASCIVIASKALIKKK